jgi:hypothetical protein
MLIDTEEIFEFTMICPHCEKTFEPRWESYGDKEKVSIIVMGCDSCPVYGVRIECPHCGKKEDMKP